MCGRFFLVAPAVQVIDALGLSNSDPGLASFGPRYNITPIQTILTVTGVGAGRRVVSPAIWGMVPAWASRGGESIKPLINVRSETALEKPTFRRAMNVGRCLIPASGFFEWLATNEKSKVPHVIQPPRRKRLMVLVGVSDPGADPSQRAAAIMTRASAGPVKGIHERMPLCMEPDDFDAWLDPSRDGKAVEDVLQRAIERTAVMELEAFAVGKDIGKATADGAGLIEPAKFEPAQAPKSKQRKDEQPGLFG